MHLDIIDVPAIAEISEIALDQGMLNREAAVIRFEVAFGYISLMGGSVWQHVVPRAVLGWPREGDGFVPCLASSKVSVDIDNYSPVVEQRVLHDVTNRKTCTRHPYHRFRG